VDLTYCYILSHELQLPHQECHTVTSQKHSVTIPL